MQPEHHVCPAESLVTDIVDAVHAPAGPPIVLVCGPDSAELRIAVDETRRRLGVSATRVKVVNLSFNDPTAGFDLANRIPPLPALRENPGTVLFFKNTHRLPVEAIGAFEALARQLASTGTRSVCAVALPLPPEARAAFGAAFERLRRDNLVRHVTVRPVPRRLVPDLVTSLIDALPEAPLCDALWSLTRGWPNAMATALRMGRDHGLIAVVDRHAYRTTWHRQILVDENDELLAAVRELGPTAWRAAKAIAVFGPLGPTAVRLVAEALGLTEQEAEEALGELARAGVLRYARSTSTWRFRLPMAGFSLESAAGPYERRKLAQLAVTALWQGTARCDEPTYLPDLLVKAGRLVDAERARGELMLASGHAAPGIAGRSLPWLRAAAQLASDRAERVEILLVHARTCLPLGDARSALESTSTVLRVHAEEIPDGQLVTICALHLTALHRSGEIKTLEQVADGTWWPWPGTPVERAAGRAYALALLGRWQQTRDLLDEIRKDPDEALVEQHVHAISPITGLWLGDSTEFDRDVVKLVATIVSGERPHLELQSLAGALVTLGELRRAGNLLPLPEERHIRLTTATQAALAIADGRATEGLQLTRKSIATGPQNGCDANQTAMFHLAATVQLYRGKLSRALELIALARARTPALPHLLALTEACHARLFQRGLAARTMLETALCQAEQAEVVALTDPLWTCLADIAVDLGERQRLPGYLERVEEVARRMGTEQAELNRLTLHAVVHSDPAAANQVVTLLRNRGQPLELASGLERLVRFGVAAPNLLHEAYDAATGLDALMCRAWLRSLMRLHGIAVPGRQTTVSENERLLAILVADGLGNKHIAVLLDASEKSVEGRLSRLFSRTGFRSRVELASAMLTGRFQQ